MDKLEIEKYYFDKKISLNVDNQEIKCYTKKDVIQAFKKRLYVREYRKRKSLVNSCK